MDEAGAANGQDARSTFLGNSHGRDARATISGDGVARGRWWGDDGKRGACPARGGQAYNLETAGDAAWGHAAYKRRRRRGAGANGWLGRACPAICVRRDSCERWFDRSTALRAGRGAATTAG